MLRGDQTSGHRVFGRGALLDGLPVAFPWHARAASQEHVHVPVRRRGVVMTITVAPSAGLEPAGSRFRRPLLVHRAARAAEIRVGLEPTKTRVAAVRLDHSATGSLDRPVPSGTLRSRLTPQPERVTRIERAGSSLARKHSTLEKHPHGHGGSLWVIKPRAHPAPWSWLRESNPLGRAYQARAPPQEPSQRESDQRDSDPRKLEWKSSALPLGHGRVELATGIEPAKTRVQTGGTTFVRRQRAKDRPCQGVDAVPLVDVIGVEPTASCLQGRRSPR